jgi:hypothetical protein
MNKWITGSLLLALLVMGAAGAVAKNVVVRSLDAAEAAGFDAGRDQRQGCYYVGNLNPAAWAISGWLAPPESYMYVFDPGDDCTDCPDGWRLTHVQILLQTDAAADIVLAGSLLEAIYPFGPDCPYPGPIVCETDLLQVSIPGEGMWDVMLPIECDCAFFGYDYVLQVTFDSVSGSVDLITDEYPSACTSWNLYGTTMADLVDDVGFPGNLMMWGIVECCDTPVAHEKQTWGGIKTLYR